MRLWVWCQKLAYIQYFLFYFIYSSFVYHLFMNLERGETIYYRLLQLDMFGIWMSQSFGKLILPSIYEKRPHNLIKENVFFSFDVVFMHSLAMTKWLFIMWLHTIIRFNCLSHPQSSFSFYIHLDIIECS